MGVSRAAEGLYFATSDDGRDLGSFPSADDAQAAINADRALTQGSGFDPTPDDPPPPGPPLPRPVQPKRLRWLPDGRVARSRQPVALTVVCVAVPVVALIAAGTALGAWAGLLVATGATAVLGMLLGKRYLAVAAISWAVLITGYRYGPAMLAVGTDPKNSGSGRIQAVPDGPTVHLGPWNGALSLLLIWMFLLGVVYCFHALRGPAPLARWLRRTVLVCGLPGLAVAVWALASSRGNPFAAALVLLLLWGPATGAVMVAVCTVLGVLELAVSLRHPDSRKGQA